MLDDKKHHAYAILTSISENLILLIACASEKYETQVLPSESF